MITSFGLGEIIGNQRATGRVAKWAIELMGLDISYVSQTAIKSQALADFIMEWTETQTTPMPAAQEYWNMYFDGSFTLNGAGGGVILISPTGDRLLYAIRLHFRATNNVAEYEALLNGLRIAAELGARRLYVRGDSELVVTKVEVKF